MVTLRIGNVDSDLIFENLPELIQTFSQSYVSKILSLLLKDVKNFYVRFTPLSIERRYASQGLGKKIMDHYLNQSGMQFFNSLKNSETLGNPQKMVNKLSETVYNILQLGDAEDGPGKKGKDGKSSKVNAKEAFFSVFDAYSQVSGNVHSSVLRKFFDEKDLNTW